MTAEKWIEYQENYKKYGLEMKPVAPRKQEQDATRERPCISRKEKVKAFTLTLLCGVLCIALIITAAYCAQIKYQINAMMAEADMVRGEIENLNVAIKSATNVAIIEEKALSELGMVYPEPDQIAYVQASSNELPDFGLTLKQIAFHQ